MRSQFCGTLEHQGVAIPTGAQVCNSRTVLECVVVTGRAPEVYEEEDKTGAQVPACKNSVLVVPAKNADLCKEDGRHACKKKNNIELMASDRKLKASREGNRITSPSPPQKEHVAQWSIIFRIHHIRQP